MDTTDAFANGELLATDDDVKFPILVGSGDAEILTLDSDPCWMARDDDDDPEGTMTPKEELVADDRCEVDAIRLAFPITEDGCFTSVTTVVVLLLNSTVDFIKTSEDVPLAAAVSETIAPVDEVCSIDDPTEAEVEVVFGSTADDILKSTDVKGKVLLSTAVDEMAIPKEETCLLDDAIVAERVTVEELLPNTMEDVIKPCEDDEGKVPLSTAVDETAIATEEVWLLDDTVVAE